MRPPEHSHGDADAELCRAQEFAPVQFLSAIDHSQKRNDRCVCFEIFKGSPEADAKPAVAVPDSEEMVADQADAKQPGPVAVSALGPFLQVGENLLGRW